MSDEFCYSGSELELFRTAINWKETLKRHIQPHIRGRVLEVGAGIGGTTAVLRTGREDSWTCLEPDGALASEIERSLPAVEVKIGTLDLLPEENRYDTVLYVDVLEHIEDDEAEVRMAVQHLAAGGRLLVLAPAHQWLFSRFDESIGHYRRYNRKSLQALAQPGLKPVRICYLDSAGLLASTANKLFLSQKQPTPGQIQFWDRILVRASRWLDPLFGYRVGKSVLAVWEA